MKNQEQRIKRLERTNTPEARKLLAQIKLDQKKEASKRLLPTAAEIKADFESECG